MALFANLIALENLPRLHQQAEEILASVGPFDPLGLVPRET
jgi:hypothetical protein